MPHTQGPNARFSHYSEGFGQELFERLPVTQTGTEFGGFGAEPVVIKGLHRFFERINARDDFTHPLQLPIVTGAKNLFHR